MKHSSRLKKSLCLLLLSACLFTFCACGKNAGTAGPSSASPSPSAANAVQPTDSGTPQASDESQAKDDAIAAYKKFLAGNMDAQDAKKEISDGVVQMKDISLAPDLKTYYAIFDMNNDGIPELHLRPVTGGSYAVFTYLDGKIVLWHNGPDYESPLNNGAILYQRDGAAPTHTNYYYLVLDADGNETSKVSFAKYHSTDKNGSSESADYDVFTFEDKEVTKEKWDSLTKEYFSIPSDQSVWKEA